MRTILGFCVIVLIGVFSGFVSYAQISSTITQTVPVTEVLNQAVCLSIITGQNASSSWALNTCTINASKLQSPFFLTNFSATLIIPSTATLNLASGFGFANYGMLNNSGIILVKAPLINYGQMLNFRSVSIQNTFVQMNTTGASVLTSGFFTNEPTGTITVTSTGFLYNGNRLINNGVIQNSGTVCNFIKGLSVNGTISGNVVSGNVVKC